MPNPNLVPLTGSHREPVQEARDAGPSARDELLQLTVQLVPRDPDVLAAKIASPGYTPYTHDQLIRAHAPSEETRAAVRAYLEDNGLSVTAVSPDGRALTVTGTVAGVERAFHTQLRDYEAGGRRFHARTGPLAVPAELEPLIEGVFGIDVRPFARPHLRRPRRNQDKVAPLTALDVAAAYNFPDGDGHGQTIALLELGGGYQQSDLEAYFGRLNLAVPPVAAVGVQGGQNRPGGDPQGADGEVELDIEVAGAIAPGAHVVVYFGADASENSFVAVLNAIVNDAANAPSVVSISWGGPEMQSTAAARKAMDTSFQVGAALGMTFLAAAGDNGAPDQATGDSLNVDYPASSPYVTGCGGTELTLANGSRASEVVWNEARHGEGATGGGISVVYPVPAWQQAIALPAQAAGAGTGRGVPDVAGNADPRSGYDVYVDGQSEPIGGTSAVAPLWAGLIARMNGIAGERMGFLNPRLYQAQGQGFDDIRVGNNSTPQAHGYTAGVGWDACTGWGVPDGTQLVQVLTARPAR